MEEDQELRFVCKLCNKKYPCGKSLGGHMRSHVLANSAESEEKLEANMKRVSSLGIAGQQSVMNESKIAEFGNGQSSYGLRENPRKSWRAVDSSFPLSQERVCKQCGKAFQSLKALCGHMACHSERDRGLKDDHSWTSENQKLVMDSHSDTEAEDRILRTRSSKSNKRYKKIVVKSPSFSLANNGSSSVSEIDGEEQEEVAMCLMLLSRDSGNKGGVNSVVESSDNNSVILETKSSSIDMRTKRREALKEVDEIPQMKKIGDMMKLKDSVLEVAQVENSDSGYFLDECAKAESDVSVDGFRRNGVFGEYSKPLNGSYEEYGAEFRHSLNRSKTYRAELKRELAKENDYDTASNSARIESRRRRYISENPESCNEYGRITRNEPPNNAEACNISLKKSKYECFNCKKAFKSYQALGGHRPCHKRNNAFYESRYESGENSLDDSTEFVTTGKLVESASNRRSSAKNSSHYVEKKIKAKKNKGHVCPFCNRVFKNGQALGGHKRSHFIGGHEENNHRSPVAKPDMLDLNLPAPEEDEDDGRERFSPW
ncbi:UNVERIFIED_CONTAM: Zinc finger protein ZAT9 [Sesamum latifolium]|uniref:Zinc finger protein ZAT9 n=1 Tax=Sesamum latifolium TaxID=2727402 RepID=A0AAW2X049_9LAMI